MLDDAVASLKPCLEEGEMEGKGNKPLRASGTRFIGHKIAAIRRIIERYGGYLAHLTSLTEDSTVTQVDKQNISYMLKWRNSKVLLGCALFHDILQPAAAFSMVLQNDELCIIDSIESILKTNDAIIKLKTTPFEELQTVLSRLHRSDDEVTYQEAPLIGHKESIAYLTAHKNEYMELVLTCLKERVKLQHPELLTNTLTLLATHGWQRSDKL